jgi:hypothetical protein
MSWIDELRLYALREIFAEKFRKSVLASWQSMPEADREKVRAAGRKQEARRQRAKIKRNSKGMNL